MGLYDDDLAGPRSSDSYREARSRVEALTPAPTAGMPAERTLSLLRDALQGLAAVEAEYPWLPDVDKDFVGLRSSCVGIARWLRTLAVAGELKLLFEGLLSEHARFSRLLDERPGTKVEMQEGSFFAPPGFRMERDEDGRRVFVRPELHSPVCFNAMEKVLPAAMSPELFAVLALERLREELPGLSLSERRLRRLDAADAFELAFTFPDRDGTLRGRQIVTVHGNVGITLTYVAPVATFERYAPAIDEMVESFRFAGGSGR